MNKVLSVLLVIAIAVSVVPYARSLGEPSPPPGISASNWVAMGDAAGFVITHAGNDFRKGVINAPNITHGYFMVRVKGSWLRADASEGYQTQPAVLEH